MPGYKIGFGADLEADLSYEGGSYDEDYISFWLKQGDEIRIGLDAYYFDHTFTVTLYNNVGNLSLNKYSGHSSIVLG